MHVHLRGDLRLHFQAHSISAFFPLLQRGFWIPIAPCTILDVLCKICAFDPEETHNRIQTLFLNGKPVDDMDTAYVQAGDELALSAAMPGLVGATMRSGGVLAGFRHSISHRSPAFQSQAKEGPLSIKLFNLLIRELGPRFLERGILTTGDDLSHLLASLSARDWNGCRKATLDSRTVDAPSLASMDWPSGPGWYRLQVRFG